MSFLRGDHRSNPFHNGMANRLAPQERANLMLEPERERIARDMHDNLGSGLTQSTLLGEVVRREMPCGNETRSWLDEVCSRMRALKTKTRQTRTCVVSEAH